MKRKKVIFSIGLKRQNPTYSPNQIIIRNCVNPAKVLRGGVISIKKVISDGQLTENLFRTSP
jgi:hypothetical protein